MGGIVALGGIWVGTKVAVIVGVGVEVRVAVWVSVDVDVADGGVNVLMGV